MKKNIIIQGILSTIVAAALYMTRTFDDVGTFLFEFSTAVAVLSIPLYFLQKQTFKVWGKFASVYIVVSVSLVFWSTFHSDWLLDQSIVTLLLAILFFISSILLFIIVSLRNRNKSAK